MSYWLFKTEPSTFSFSELLKLPKTNWNGIRNYQARNFLREVKKGEPILIYHSGKEKSVVGIAQTLGSPYSDPDPKDPKGDWLQVDIKAVCPLKSPISLAIIKKTPSLKNLLLVKNSRLSTMKISEQEYNAILKLGEAE